MKTTATMVRFTLFLTALTFTASWSAAADESTRLLREPTVSAEHIAFVYGADLWIVPRDGGRARRLTSTAAVESDPHFSPDGQWLAFSSDRSGVSAVYVLPISGGTPQRLSWYPAGSSARGWSPDGSRVLYASSRQTAPSGYRRLWTVAAAGGPSELVPAPWGNDGSFAPGGAKIVIDRVSRWDSEWRRYRGGQNTPLVILDLDTLAETRLPNEGSADIQPLWLGDRIYFLSDRSWATNVFSYDPRTKEVTQLTEFPDEDVKWLAGHGDTLVFEHGGWIHSYDLASGASRPIPIQVQGDFPWMETRWETLDGDIRRAALSATGKRALFEARGEIFSVPVDKGDTRNLSRSSGAADHEPLWSPDGREVAWFSDSGAGYELLIAAQDGLSSPRHLSIGDSKMVWEPTWSPDGSRIAFVDDDTRVRVIELENGALTTADVGGSNLDRGAMQLCWSPDSRWLAYSKSFPNSFHRIMVWSVDGNEAQSLTDPLADAVAPAWDRDGRHLYFLASTDLALASGWANTSTMQVEPTYAPYVIVLRSDDPSPFAPESDEEEAAKDDAENAGESQEKEKAEGKATAEDEPPEKTEVRIDAAGLARRTLSLPMPAGGYVGTLSGPEGSVFVAERSSGAPGLNLHKFSLEKREAELFVGGARRPTVSNDGSTLLFQTGDAWKVVSTEAPPSGKEEALKLKLETRLDRRAEWQQIFDEAWRYERDFFYDPSTHGRDWDEVRARYAPLVPHVRHRAELNVILDRMNGELSVGHSFVFGGDLPETPEPKVGLLGADLEPHEGHWRISRIYTFGSWNPGLAAPLDRPGLEVAEGDYVLAVNGRELAATDDPYRLFDGTAGRQTVLHVNGEPSMDGARQVVVEPTDSETELRRLAWVEDNRRRVDELSGGALAYVWVPNTGNQGVVSFNRYFFAQQDKQGAVIDERFNGGGLLDDYMVDLMGRTLRAALTNEAPGAEPFRLPAGILGPKVLLINEMAGSGGDYFPWVFRHQGIGPLIGARTWGGLVKSSVHYPLVDGGALTAPDNAVFDPAAGEWVAENRGVAPDIEVLIDARSAAEGRDPQLERGVEEALRLLQAHPQPEVVPPPYPRPAAR